MNSGQRTVVVSTGLALAVLAGLLTLLSWDRANQVAGLISALVSVAGLGASVWGLLSSSHGPSIQVSSTGKATASGNGKANTGFISPQGDRISGSIVVNSTGDAESENSDSNTGFRVD